MSQVILMAHGSGGQMSHELIHDLFLRYFDNVVLADLGDAGCVEDAHLRGGRLALTTDSYVVKPLFFPGGDVGKLAICGTVNDLAVAGAQPLYLTAGFILEEGLPLETLERVVRSMAETARLAGVQIVAGDTKVVERGAADGLFINTAGVGALLTPEPLTPRRLRAGDVLLINGPIGDHGLAIMLQREGLTFHSDLTSDCAPLNGLIAALLDALGNEIRCMRDPTRGGLATTLNEWAGCGVGIEVDEEAVPVRPAARAACEILGLDPLYIANEGKVLVAVAPAAAERALAVLRAHPLGAEAAIIGQVTEEHPGRVVLRTPYRARRVIEMLAGDPLPRIC
ncbi:MAG: hydrogenase expression/formation protein HypE [Anaerolineae bacterium]